MVIKQVSKIVEQMEKQDMAKIGMEAFEMLDEFQRHNKINVGAHHNHNANNNNGREILDSYQAAKMFGGLVITEHRVKKKAVPQSVIRYNRFHN